MPIYEFICQECRNTVELLALKKGDLLELECPHCHSENLERVLSTVNVGASSASGNQQPAVENRSCASGSCSTITLPGHSK